MNNSKTICIIRSNAVDPDSRVEKEAATLKKAGYNVIILAWDRSGNHKERKEILKVYKEEIAVYRFGYKAQFGAGMRSIVPYMKFQFSQFRWLIRNRKKIDAIHACDFDTALFSSVANCFIKKKYLFDIFDFICGNPQTLFQKLVKNLQISIINKADATIICTEKRKVQIKDSHPKSLEIIHNTPIKIGSENLEKEEREDKKENDNEKVKVVYVGILQDYRLLLEIAEVFKENLNLELHIGGFGKYEEFFENLSLKHNNIIYHGKLSYKDTIELENNCDIMLAIYDPSIENHVFAAPNKFYESLMLGKPVIMVNGTGMSEYVVRNDIGVVIDYSAESFLKGVQSLIGRKAEWDDMGNRMKQIYENEFCWNLMEKRLINLYNNILK